MAKLILIVSLPLDLDFSVYASTWYVYVCIIQNDILNVLIPVDAVPSIDIKIWFSATALAKLMWIITDQSISASRVLSVADLLLHSLCGFCGWLLLMWREFPLTIQLCYNGNVMLFTKLDNMLWYNHSFLIIPDCSIRVINHLQILHGTLSTERKILQVYILCACPWWFIY